jgi:nickel-dependent lactate racemase
MLGGALALNTVVDEARNLSFVNFGEIVASHAQAVAFVRNYAEVSVKQRFKTVVTSAAGYPLDRTYYQTVKGMVGPLDILEPGGRLIVASECSEGLGSAVLESIAASGDPAVAVIPEGPYVVPFCRS